MGDALLRPDRSLSRDMVLLVLLHGHGQGEGREAKHLWLSFTQVMKLLGG